MIIYNLDNKLLYEINPTKGGENKMPCPACSPTRKKSKDKCFSWNADKNVGKCMHCGANFMLYNNLKQQPPKEYFVPEWKNNTQLTDKAVNWFTGRMISQQTLNDFKIYSDKEWMPQFNKEVEVICYPYLVDGVLKNIKFRGPNKSFKMVKDAELVLFNFDCVKDYTELIICEGEGEALTWYECGFKNVVSVPNGASGKDLVYLDNYIERLDHIEKFYIATDFDDPGLSLRNELIRRLGIERCSIVTFQGYKDSNELLCASGGLAIRECLQNAQEAPIPGLINIRDIYDDAYSMYLNGLSEGERIGMPGIDEHIRWETGRLATWTGIPGHGKSEFVDFIVTQLNMKHGWKALYFSPENFPLQMHVGKIAEKLVGCPFKQVALSQMNFDASFDYIADNFFWIDPYEEPTLDYVLSKAEYYIKTKGIKQLIIDPFNTLEHNPEKNETETTYIGKFLNRLVNFARRYDIIIHLVAHPTKLQKLGTGVYPPPTLYDISGSSHFFNKTDYGATVYRNFAEKTNMLYITKVKFRNLGQAQSDPIMLKYNVNNGRYSELPPNGNVFFDNTNWLNNEGEQTEMKTYTNYYEKDDESTPF